MLVSKFTLVGRGSQAKRRHIAGFFATLVPFYQTQGVAFQKIIIFSCLYVSSYIYDSYVIWKYYLQKIILEDHEDVEVGISCRPKNRRRRAKMSAAGARLNALCCSAFKRSLFLGRLML
jgi:hypothetical protein